MSKCHLVVCENPLPVNRSIETCCGEKIDHAQVVYAWDSQEMGPVALSTLLFCSKCLQGVPADSDRKYIYGVIQPKTGKSKPEQLGRAPLDTRCGE